tara:strand:- start:98 stop:1135 length:1038 start_codon:yes stop_codon:yes gene_type:complete
MTLIKILSKKRIILPILYSFFFLFFSPIYASTLDTVKSRGYLICGVSENFLGFASLNDEGEWVGFDVDMCRAVAAAIFGDSKKVDFVSTTSRSRFPILASGEIDMLARNTTWTFSRDSNLSFEFVGINFYDGQGFMVRKSLGINKLQELNGSTICLETGSPKEFNVVNYFNKKDIEFKIHQVEIDNDAIENYLAERCDVYTNFISELAVLKTKIPVSSKHKILPFVISKEPLGPLVRHGDNEWADIVRWSLNTLIIAEEYGINSDNLDSFLDSDNHEILRLLGVEGNFGDMLELEYNWAYNIIKQVGNYQIIFDRNIGSNSVLGIERGINALWLDGGILYSPPFR